jgi:4-hydroxybenzoate polyprenyltransferase
MVNTLVQQQADVSVGGIVLCLPIVVDLDQTLVLSDTLYETAAMLFFKRPLAFIQCLPQLAKGRHSLKAAIASKVNLSDAVFPIREDLVEWLHKQAKDGHELHLCSAADQSVVDSVAEHLGIFSSAIGSAQANLKGAAKADYLKKQFPGGFIYVGDHAADLNVWKESSGIVLAGTKPAVTERAKALEKPVFASFDNPKLNLKAFLKAIRVHHWSKNVLMFVPLILAHEWTNVGLWLHAIVAFTCLLAVTSATYLLNDIADVHADRHHWTKRNRAIASGRMAIRSAFLLAVGLLVGGFAVAFTIAPRFGLALLAYLVITGAYSLGLKRVPLLDMLIIGVLFTLRLVMGVALLADPHPEWLLTFAVFFFFSLASAKRHTEIVRASLMGETSLKSRGYEIEDAPLTLAMGLGTAIASLVVMMIFILQELLPSKSYSHPQPLVLIPLVLSIWLGRIWLLSHRGKMNDDPVSFAIRDRTSIGLGVVIALLFVVAL